MREPEADKHCHLTKQAELSGKGHMMYGHLKFALTHSSQSLRVPPILHTHFLANGSNALWDVGTSSAEVH